MDHKRLCSIFLLLATVKKFTLAHECGNVLFSRGLVVKGTAVSPGQWPFLVALKHAELNSFFCGGNLISSTHVLTAAHCIQYKYTVEKKQPHEIILLVGHHNLSAIESNSVDVGVSKIYVHPDWDILAEKWDADIAILLMKKTVAFTKFIQPVCLPAGISQKNEYEGFVVGWGLSEFTDSTHHEDVPRQVTVKSVSDAECYTNDIGLASISSPRTFCAGGDKAGPCSGDSGGGLYLLGENYWSLKGIVSSSIFTADNKCDVGRKSIFTNVVKYLDWIESKCDCVKKKLAMKCSFEQEYEWSFQKTWYTCKTVSLNVQSGGMQITSIIGTQIGDKTIYDVEILSMHQQNLKYLPLKIGYAFPILKKLSARKSHVQFIQKETFVNMKSLKILDFVDNEIDSISKDTLEDLTGLVILDLRKNMIKTLHEDTFENLVQLSQIYLDENRIQELEKYIFLSNSQLTSISIESNNLRRIFVDFTRLRNIRTLSLNNNPCLKAGFEYHNKVDDIEKLQEMQEEIETGCRY